MSSQQSVTNKVLTKDELSKITDDDWKKRLSEDEYNICRQKHTEEKFSGEYLKNKDNGVYNCTCCGYDLFSSEKKYDSGCGWPSYTSARGATSEKKSDGEHVLRTDDDSYGYMRTEITCKNCGSHVGHVFPDGPDGPEDSGERFCVNSASVKFAKDT